MTDRIISLDAAIEALKAEYVSGETGDVSDIAYNLALDHAIEALSALPAVEGEFICKRCGIRTNSQATIDALHNPPF